MYYMLNKYNLTSIWPIGNSTGTANEKIGTDDYVGDRSDIKQDVIDVLQQMTDVVKKQQQLSRSLVARISKIVDKLHKLDFTKQPGIYSLPLLTIPSITPS